MLKIVNLFRISLSLIVITIVTGQNKNYGHSKLVLFKGKERYEIDGKSCTVGVAFAKSERFSCACVNGIWAFYGEPCAPLAIVAGNNYCFQMPNIAIRQVSSISSPMRALSNSLTAFEPTMEGVKAKFYRSVHMNLNGSTPFIATNSSWTLESPDGEQKICLSSKKPQEVPIEGSEDPQAKKIQTYFCTFANLTERFDTIGAIFKGCNESLEMFEPTDCQPILQANSEEVCTSLAVVESFNPDIEPEVGNDIDFFRKSRSSNLQNWGSTTTTSTTTEATTTTTTDRYPPEYYGAPQWLKRQIEVSIDAGNYTRQNNLAKGRAIGSETTARNLSEAEILELMKKEWENPMNFTLPPATSSDLVITDQLWKYERMIIRKTLKISTPEDMSIAEKVSTSKAAQLLQISSDVMKKLCPLQKPEYFDMVISVFLQIQEKIFRWNPPYLKTLDFKRIEASLTACRENAETLITVKGGDGSCQGGSTVDPAFPEALKSEGFEPIVESVWKILVSAHSYCYKNFDQFYNDHHKFTTIMFPFFTNEIHRHWFNKTGGNGEDYSGIIGPVAKIMSNIDQCTYAARKASSFPFHLTRPTTLVQYDPTYQGYLEESKESKKSEESDRRRRKREAPEESENSGDELIRTKREEEIEEGEEEAQIVAWKRQNQIFSGLGYCLKKYNHPKLYLKHICERSEI